MRNSTERHFDVEKARLIGAPPGYVDLGAAEPHAYTGQVTTYGGGRTWGCSCGAQGAKVWRHPGYKAYYVEQQAAAIRRSHGLHVRAEG